MRIWEQKIIGLGCIAMTAISIGAINDGTIGVVLVPAGLGLLFTKRRVL